MQIVHFLLIYVYLNPYMVLSVVCNSLKIKWNKATRFFKVNIMLRSNHRGYLIIKNNHVRLDFTYNSDLKYYLWCRLVVIRPC
jgi:hypothetical protein